MKQRFTFLDIRAIVNEIKPLLVDKFIQNFYSTQQRVIYIKFSSKDILLIEPGIRMHLTKSSDDGISHFCNILRKKARRDKVKDIYQVGFDRVVVFVLTRQKIVVEFFSGGNIFILDENDKIMEVFRVVKELDIIKNTQYVFNEVVFDFSWKNFLQMEINEFLPFEKELVDDIISKINKDMGIDIIEYKKEVLANINEIRKNKDMGNINISLEENSTMENKQVSVLKDNLINKDIKNLSLKNAEIFETHMNNFLNFINEIKNFGGIKVKKGKYENIVPYDINVDKVFESFNAAAEEYFADRKKAKKDKIDKSEKVKLKQYEHIRDLEEMANEMLEKSTLIRENEELIMDIIKIHKTVLKNKMKWEDFCKFKEAENKKGNIVSQSIVSTDFKNETCIIRIPKEAEDKIEEVFIEIYFNKSLHQNIENYFAKRKKYMEKIEKTKQAIETVKVKSYKKEEKVKIIRPVHWFEKFNFCFSTDKKLIIGGKNMQQNEILVKKYLTPTHLYFHTEVSGGSSILLQDPTEVSIEEAALMALCNSTCWDKQVVSPVFYVKGDQVSKTPPTGQYLNKGSFLIKGTKTYVNCYKLEYGLGLLFKLSNKEDILEANPEEYYIEYENNVFVTDPKDYEIEYAIPVSGPYKVISSLYKYKVRILPGKDKKGKIVQGIISKFCKESEERIIKIIKRMSVEEFVNVLPSNIKIGKEQK